MTGAAGFLGRHFTAELERRGWDVERCDLRMLIQPGRVEYANALLLFASSETRFDLVVHAAAWEPHRAAIDAKPAGHVYNQLLDAAMFNWAIRTGQGRVLYLSSSAAYPVDLQRYGVEVTALGDAWPRYLPSLGALSESAIDLATAREPDSTYGWVKLTGERLAVSARAAGLPVTVVRPFSGYGEDQAEDFPFGAFIGRAKRGEDPFPLWNADAVRDWVHVDDVVNGALAVVESGTDEPVNLCTGIGTSCGDLAAMVAKVAGYAPEFQPQGDKPAGVAYRVGDPTRLRKYYTPRVTLADGIARALA